MKSSTTRPSQPHSRSSCWRQSVACALLLAVLVAARGGEARPGASRRTGGTRWLLRCSGRPHLAGARVAGQASVLVHCPARDPAAGRASLPDAGAIDRSVEPRKVIDHAGRGLTLTMEAATGKSGAATRRLLATDFACMRTDHRAFDTDNTSPLASPVRIPTQAETCWSFAFQLTLTDVFTAPNGTSVRLDAKYEGILVLAEPNRTCDGTWTLSTALGQYGNQFTESAHTLAHKPYVNVSINMSRVCRDTFCEEGSECLSNGLCPTRCGGCDSSLYDWALVRTDITDVAETRPAMCCNETTCAGMAQDFVTDVRSALPSGFEPPPPPPPEDIVQPSPESDGDGSSPLSPPRRVTTKEGHISTPAAVGVALGGATGVALLVCAGILTWRCRRRRQELQLQQQQLQQHKAASGKAYPSGSNQEVGLTTPQAASAPSSARQSPASQGQHSNVVVVTVLSQGVRSDSKRQQQPQQEPQPAQHDAQVCGGGSSSRDCGEASTPTSGPDAAIRPPTAGAGTDLDSCMDTTGRDATPEAAAAAAAGAAAPPTLQGRRSLPDGGGGGGSPALPRHSSTVGAGPEPPQRRIRWSTVTLGREIGSGRAGSVFEAHWHGQRVAVKMLDYLVAVGGSSNRGGGPMSRAELRGALTAHAALMAAQQHPNLAMVHGFVDGTPYLAVVMELHRAGSLRDRLASADYTTKLSMADRLRLGLQIAQGLAFLHDSRAEPMVHGDLQPGNVLLKGSKSSQTAVLADWGLAALAPDVFVSRTDEADDFEEEGAAADKAGAAFVRYTPPEVLTKPLAPRTAAGDVYALAMVLLEVLTGQPGFPDLRGAAALRQAVASGARPCVPPDAGVPPGVAAVMHDCWATRPLSRPSAATVVDCMSRALDELQRDPKEPQLQEREAQARNAQEH